MIYHRGVSHVSMIPSPPEPIISLIGIPVVILGCAVYAWHGIKNRRTDFWYPSASGWNTFAAEPLALPPKIDRGYPKEM